jgi:hypothetical protein
MKNPFKLSIIKADETNGVVTLVPNLTSIYRVEVADYFGNQTMVSIPIKFESQSIIVEKEPLISKYYVKSNKDINFAKDNISVFLPAGTFYDDFNMNFEVKNDTLFLHEDTVPAHSNFTISIEDNKYSEAQKDKLFIASFDEKKIKYNPTFRRENVFTAKAKVLGKFTLVLDTIAPKITISKPVEGKWISDRNTIQFTISDSLSGIKSYNGYLNGKWILFEYDNKTKKITHDFNDGVVADGANDLKLIVIDNLGNSTIFETHFFRSQKNKN